MLLTQLEVATDAIWQFLVPALAARTVFAPHGPLNEVQRRRSVWLAQLDSNGPTGRVFEDDVQLMWRISTR